MPTHAEETSPLARQRPPLMIDHRSWLRVAVWVGSPAGAGCGWAAGVLAD